jgi:twitching motility protein PilT
MAKIDVYLRSIERFGAAGAILTSGQAITLRFPQGDRHATQVTPHDQLVGLVREIAPAPALDQIDKNRPAKFEVDSGGTRYSLDVNPKPGQWQVIIAAATAGAVPSPSPVPSASPVARPAPRPAQAAGAAGAGDEMAIERGQYADAAPAVSATSGSGLLDSWTTAARSSRATDIYLATGAGPVARVGGELQPIGERGALDAETISRELGVVAPAEARAAWTERGSATFTYSDGMGRVRATLVRDHRGPGAALRLLVGEPPQAERIGLGGEVAGWLGSRGLILVAGPSGVGKTTTIAALVRSLADQQRRVVTLEDPIEILHTGSPWVSQRALGEHVPTVSAGVAAAMYEGADAIVLGAVSIPEAAAAIVAAVAGGHLVVASITTTAPRQATERLVDLLPADLRDLGRATLQAGLIGTIAPVVKGTGRTFEVVARRDG